jgi:hypothetical protein
MKTSLETEKENVQENVKKAQSLQDRFDSLSRIEKEIQRTLQSLELTKAEKGRLTSAKRELKEVKLRQNTLDVKLKDLSNIEQMTQRQVKSTQEKIERIVKTEENKMALIQGRLEEALDEKEEMEKQRQGTLSVVDKHHQLIQQLQEQMDRTSQEHEEFVDGLRQSIELLQSQVSNYHSGLYSAQKTLQF